MTPEDFLLHFLDPCLHWLEQNSGPKRDYDARRFLLAVALQEAGPDLMARYQNHPADDPGPARGWWQFEQGGGVAGVLTHTASIDVINHVCGLLVVHNEPAACWRAIEGNDLLAVAFARMLAYTDPAPIPSDETAAWDFYLRCWRPGKPHPETWPGNWNTATSTVTQHPQ
jgi:hypothetical protein